MEALITERARERGCSPNGVRDAVHEAWHATSLGVEVWSREEIHSAILALRPADVFRQEVCARAAEWAACERLGIPYDAREWALIAYMEAVKGVGLTVNIDDWLACITAAKASPEVAGFVGAIFAPEVPA